MYVRTRIETGNPASPGQALYNLTYSWGGPTNATVIADTDGSLSYFNVEGQTVAPMEPWRKAVEAWREQNKGVWP